MIHQFIFAAPKPGMSIEDFQNYWMNVHAVKYASKIPQIKRYMLDLRVPFEGDLGSPLLPHQGIAEIWLNNDTEQLESLQTDEFLQGARLDEPTWAAFWMSMVVDTTAHEIVTGRPLAKGQSWIKLTILSKRKPGMLLHDYRERTLASYAPIAAKLPGLRRYLHCHTRDGFYVFGESQFDSVEQFWFDDENALRSAMASPYYVEHVKPAHGALFDPRYVFSIAATEHWIIGPDARP